MLREDKSDWSPACSIPTVDTGIVFLYALFETLSSSADIIGPVCTAQNVEMGACVQAFASLFPDCRFDVSSE
jgi:hypothetical protein